MGHEPDFRLGALDDKERQALEQQHNSLIQPGLVLRRTVILSWGRILIHQRQRRRGRRPFFITHSTWVALALHTPMVYLSH